MKTVLEGLQRFDICNGLCLAPGFPQLLDTKSTDRKMTLLHYIALIIKEKYSDLANFYSELHYVDKAAAGGGEKNL